MGVAVFKLWQQIYSEFVKNVMVDEDQPYINSLSVTSIGLLLKNPMELQKSIFR